MNLNNLYNNEESNVESLAARPAYLAINFKSLFMELLDKLFVILLCGVLAGLVSYCLHAYVILPSYESNTKIYVLPQNNEDAPSYSDLEVGQQLANDYIEVVQGRSVVEETIEYFGLDEKYDDFCRKRLTVDNQTGTRILSISLKDKDPVMARDMAVKLRESAVDAIETGMGIEGVTVIEEANLPIIPVYSSILIAAIAAILVCMIAVIIVCLHYIISDRVISADDIEERIGLTVLGSIMFEKDSRIK